MTRNSISKKSHTFKKESCLKNGDVLFRGENLVVVNSVVFMPHHFCEDCIVLKTFISLTALNRALCRKAETYSSKAFGHNLSKGRM